MLLYKVCFVLTLLSCSYGSVDIEKYLGVCERNSPDVNECLVEAIQKGIAVMADGIADLGVPPVDPYHQKELRVDYKNNQIIAKMVMKNIYVIGLKNAEVRDARLRADEDSFHLEIDMFSPKMRVKGQYSGSGSYNALRINASGEFNTTMTDLTYTWKLDGKTEEINGETYMRIKDFYMRPDVGDMKTYMSNNNPDSKELTDLAVRITNENWRTLYREMLPFAQNNWNKIGIRVANKIFLKVPYDKLFPVK